MIKNLFIPNAKNFLRRAVICSVDTQYKKASVNKFPKWATVPYGGYGIDLPEYTPAPLGSMGGIL